MILINGQKTDVISYQDRGFQFGDGVFETIALVQGRCVFWSEHMARLQLGCERLGIMAPNVAVLAEEAQAVILDEQRGVLKIIVTRGVSDRGYQFLSTIESTRVVFFSSWPRHILTNRRSGVCVRVCQTRLASNPHLAQIKHMNRLENVLARAEWREPEIVEGLMLDQSGYVIEGTMSNVFVIEDDCVYTPSITDVGVAGVVRGVVLDYLNQHNVTNQIMPMDLERVLAADGLFITNSLIGIWPVSTVLQNDRRVTYSMLDIIFRLQEQIETHFIDN